MHDGTAFGCDFCNMRFYKKNKLEQHCIVHTFTYACDVDGCEKKFTRKNTMQRHKRDVHEKVQKYACEQYGRRFSRIESLKAHNRIHADERPYACTDCAIKFKVKIHLQRHYSFAHKLKRSHACSHCERTFTTASKRSNHLQRAHK
jgi:KRAB domain-containing zinc finger protein